MAEIGEFVNIAELALIGGIGFFGFEFFKASGLGKVAGAVGTVVGDVANILPPLIDDAGDILDEAGTVAVETTRALDDFVIKPVISVLDWIFGIKQDDQFIRVGEGFEIDMTNLKKPPAIY